MKGWFLFVVIIVLVILILMAWRKKEIVSPPSDGKGIFHFATKAKKTRAPNTKEEQWRDVFEKVTGHAYPSMRPYWLINPSTGRRLELDGYSAELRSAFEYNGRQHYEFPNSFHKTREEFDLQVERDALKVEICREMGIDLVVIPHDQSIEDSYGDIERHLRSIVKKSKRNPIPR
jgi:hypothetical protein